MLEENPLDIDNQNRRDNFRIDHILPVVIRKIHPGIAPAPHIVPIAPNNRASGEWHQGGLNPIVTEIDANFASTMIEVDSKIDILLNAQGISSSASKDSSIQLSLSHLLLQINMKLDHLLGVHNLSPPDQRIRIDSVNLSASGIKLTTDQPLFADDLVEVRMLMAAAKPFWIVVTGSVVRSIPLPAGKHEVAINFCDMDDAIRDEISRYALVNQKKQILSRRGIRS